ncbi:MAG TPA: ATP-binding protein [Pirellulales bacterium]
MPPLPRKLAVPVALQVAVVAALFLGSLGALAYDFYSARPMPQRERELKAQLREASARMAAAAATMRGGARPASVEELDAQSRALGRITTRVLSDYPGVEGGFYLNGEVDRFSGYDFPTDRPRRRHPGKNEPPPREEAYIRLQARESLSLPAGEYSATVQDVGPSRVMIVTEPVGSPPAAAATWLMYRLVDPRALDRQMRRYRASTMLALGGLLLAMLLMLRLASNLKRQQHEQARLQDELRRSERLAALGKLLAGVAHEVRNPLAAIRSTVQLWQRLPEQSRSPESLDAVIRSVDRLNETVSQLLYFSRADGTAREPVDVNQLLTETLELFAAQAAAQRVTLLTRLASDLRVLEGSPAALRQVFVNLTTNALQAMPGGGELEVMTQRGSGGGALIEFADTGPGIPSEIEPHLFEPFFTTRPEGTGLGLALCREIITQHDGTIECVELMKPGARFRIVLPATS